MYTAHTLRTLWSSSVPKQTNTLYLQAGEEDVDEDDDDRRKIPSKNSHRSQGTNKKYFTVTIFLLWFAELSVWWRR